MSILGLDYGEKKIGVAISLGIYAKGLIVINSKEAFARLKQICEKESIEKIIIGFPEGRIADKVRNFGEKLQKELGLSVEYCDETLSSKLAENILVNSGKSQKRRKAQEHQMAAALMLQSYIENKK